MQRIMMISSSGGHFIQLKRIAKHLDDSSVFYVTTGLKGENSGSVAAYMVMDCNAKNVLRAILCFFQVFSIVVQEKPTTIISTGAAPGLMAIIAGFVLKKNTVWIDSIANSRELSLSGKVAKHFASICVSQWPDVSAKHGLSYLGSIV